MNKQIKLNKRILVPILVIAVLSGITFALFVTLTHQIKVEALQQKQQNQTSIPHNAKGHQSHQIIMFQNATEGAKYTGTVNFTLSKPAFIISFDELSKNQDPTKLKVKIWEVGSKKFEPKTLLINATEGSVNFNASGVLAHSTQSDPFSGTFTVNDTMIKNANVSTSSGNSSNIQ